MPALANVAEVVSLMEELEKEDPLDFADLSLDEAEARRFVALAILKTQQDMHAASMSAEDRELTLLASTAHLVLENLVLNYRILKSGGVLSSASVQSLLDQIARPKD